MTDTAQKWHWSLELKNLYQDISRIHLEFNESQGTLTRVKTTVIIMSAKKFITDSVLRDLLACHHINNFCDFSLHKWVRSIQTELVEGLIQAVKTPKGTQGYDNWFKNVSFWVIFRMSNPNIWHLRFLAPLSRCHLIKRVKTVFILFLNCLISVIHISHVKTYAYPDIGLGPVIYFLSVSSSWS